MIGQAAKWLGTDDVAVPALHQFDHFRSQQPALAHFSSQGDDPLRLFHQLSKGTGGIESHVRLRLEHGTLDAVQPMQQTVRAQLHQVLAAIQHPVLALVEDAVLQKAQQSREVDLAALAFQETLEVVVPQGAVFDIDLAHNAYLDLGDPCHRQGGKLFCHEGERMLHLPGGKALACQQHTAQPLHPQVHQAVGSARLVLIRGGLVAQGAQQIAIQYAGQGTADQGQRHLEAAVLLQAGEVQAGHRDLRIPRLYQCFAQQMDVVRGTAAAAGLGDQQGGMFQVIFAAVQRIQKLANDQQRRVAGVVVDIFQAQLRHGTAAVAQHLTVIPLVLQRVLQKAELGHRHIGDKDLVGLFHLRGKFRVIILHGYHPPFPLHGEQLRPVHPRQRTNCAAGYSQRPGW